MILIQVGYEGMGPYAATKAGQVALIKSAAKEWARIPIRCNAVSPGVISTPLLQKSNAELVQLTLRLTPMGRQGTPDGRCTVLYHSIKGISELLVLNSDATFSSS